MIFTIPITVCKPETVKSPSHHFKDWHSSPGQIERKFLVVPEAATWVELRFTTRNHASPVNLWTHCVQLQPEVRLSKSQQQFILNCTAGETVSKSFSVSGGVTMEICSVRGLIYMLESLVKCLCSPSSGTPYLQPTLAWKFISTVSRLILVKN